MVLDPVHVSQFYACSRVSLAAELLYICELGKHSFYHYSRPVSIKGIKLATTLAKSKVWDYFRICVSQGWIVEVGITDATFLDFTVNRPKITVIEFGSFLMTTDANDHIDGIDTKRASYDDLYALSNPQYRLIHFAECDSATGTWYFDIDKGVGFTDNNFAFKNNNADKAWVAFLAMCAVERLYNGQLRYLHINFTNQALSGCKMALSYFLLLAEETTCFSSWVDYEFNDYAIDIEKIRQYGYFAWYAKGRDLGLLSKNYTIVEKAGRMKKLDLRVGDFCFFYKRRSSQKKDAIKEIESCHLAKIISITGMNIRLEFITTLRTKRHAEWQYRQMTTAVQNLWSDTTSYSKLNTSQTTVSMIDTGVEYYMSNELQFIVPLESSDDYVNQYVDDDIQLRLNQNELIYWICKDYGYDFNEKRFKQKYFPTVDPLYDRFHRGEQIDEALYVS